MKLKLKESSIVRPAEETPNHRLWISNLDLFHGNYYVQTVYVYKPKASAATFFEAEVLKEALGKALVAFYPMAGRLARDEKGRTEIDCNGEGVQFIEAETNSSMAEFGEFDPSDEVRQLIPPLHPGATDGISSQPLMLAQLTRFSCGGVCLGMAIHHHIGDGLAALHFINSWSSIARGLPIGLPPVLDRTILRARSPPTPKFQHIEYHPHPPLKNPPQNSSPPSSAVITISSDQLNDLKQKVNKKTRFSTFEVLSAHIWRCTCKARELPIDQLTKLKISVDGRSRFNPPLPPGYFGNVMFHTAVIVPAGDLLSEPIEATADRIHTAIKRMDDEYLRSAIDYLEEGGQDVIGRQKELPTTFISPNLKINSWSRLPFYEADFGWGPPWLIKAATGRADGKIFMQPITGGDGGSTLIVTLEKDRLQPFQNYFYDF